MTLDQLRAFVTVVEQGSIRAASRALGIAQSGLTQQIRRLERSLNTTLFVRGNSGVILTPDGNTLLTRAHIILGECARVEQEFNHHKRELSGNIHLGASAEACARLLPVPLAQLRTRHPNVRIHISSGPSSTLLSGIREGKLDFAVTLVSPRSDMADLTSARLTVSQPCILCRRGHPLAQATSLEELVGAEWINTKPLGQPHTPSNRLGDWFSQHKLPEPVLAVTVDSLLDTLKLVAESDYLFLGPAFVVQDGGFEKSLAAIPIQEKIPAADICLVQRRAVPLAPAARTFASMLISFNRGRKN
ncbi:LysR substrate-binding domain-containing protein [Pusillimonas sp. SM2304]|uniref:LysR substrate-binding domain-containing protein n=1 Tax=Pusillimonas sp. SM2304 TaxID=3073241 RepID=UPI002876C712|nr:LysR substrate-binding domain-containing protein [Pusillimonas sp. SM2304]MDS1140445.1 LysR substrate-binding domain-containing protein [Pusillimonas sp. SM2304]